MKANSVETILGAIVLIVALVFLIYSARTGDVQEVKGYTIHARFNQIGGLLPGDAVRISGVKVGTVKGITLTKENYLASVAMTVDNATQLPIDSAATVASSGLMGGNYVEISPGGDELMLKEGGIIEYTQDAQNLERLLGQFIFSVADKKPGEEGAEATEDAPAGTAFTAPATPTEAAEAVEEPVAEETAPVAEEPTVVEPAPEAANDNAAPTATETDGATEAVPEQEPAAATP